MSDGEQYRMRSDKWPPLPNPKVGDQLGVEIRKEQSFEKLKPYFIFVYRYGAK